MRLYVTDDDGAAVPTGGLGELRIGGPPLARGYLGAPSLTAQSFVPDPAAVDGDVRERLEAFRRVRDALEVILGEFVAAHR